MSRRIRGEFVNFHGERVLFDAGVGDLTSVAMNFAKEARPDNYIVKEVYGTVFIIPRHNVAMIRFWEYDDAEDRKG